MGQDLGHGHGGHGVGAPADDKHGHDDHGAHGHHPSPMTRELSGTLGVIAAGAVAVIGLVCNFVVGPIMPSGHHGGEAEELEWPSPLPGEADIIFTHAKIRQPGYKEATMLAIRGGKI